MLALLIPVVLCGAVGALRARSTLGLQRMHLHWWPLALGSIAIQLVLFNPPFDRQDWALTLGPRIWVACLVALVAVLVRNIFSDQAHRIAFLIAAVGVAVNLLVILANDGYMPQSTEARLAARGSPLIAEGAAPQLRSVTPASAETRFNWLGDVFPEPSWLPGANVLSIGDLLLSMSLAYWMLKLVTTNAWTQARRSTADSC